MKAPHNTPTGLIHKTATNVAIPPIVLPSPIHTVKTPGTPVFDANSIPWIDTPRECDTPNISPRNEMNSTAHKLNLG